MARGDLPAEVHKSKPEAEDAAEQQQECDCEEPVGPAFEPVVGLADAAMRHEAAADEQDCGAEGHFIGDGFRRLAGKVHHRDDQQRGSEQRRGSIENAVGSHGVNRDGPCTRWRGRP